MNLKKTILVWFFILLAGCTDKSELSCSDEIVTDTVMSITIKEMREQLFKLYLFRIYPWIEGIYNDLGYEEYKSSDEDLSQAKVISETEKTISVLHLTNIRLKSVDERTGLISCAASLVGRDGGSSSIEYTAQYTDDGQTYVEVFGLR